MEKLKEKLFIVLNDKEDNNKINIFKEGILLLNLDINTKNEEIKEIINKKLESLKKDKITNDNEKYKNILTTQLLLELKNLF